MEKLLEATRLANATDDSSGSSGSSRAPVDHSDDRDDRDDQMVVDLTRPARIDPGFVDLSQTNGRACSTCAQTVGADPHALVPCGHLVCATCVGDWVVRDRMKCPVCGLRNCRVMRIFLGECLICQTDITDPPRGHELMALPCGHVMCSECHDEWEFHDEDARCPVCRRDTELDDAWPHHGAIGYRLSV
jgi:hypothetical protein